MATEKKKRFRGERTYSDFEALLAVSERLAEYLRLLLHLSVADWSLMLDRVREGQAYREWSKSKGRGKGRRRFAAPCPELKLVQRAVYERFLVSVPVHFARHGNQRGCSIKTNVMQHAGARAVFAVDIVNAFPTVFRSRIRANLYKPFAFALRQFAGVEFPKAPDSVTDPKARLCYDFDNLLEVLVDLVCLHDRLPQGPPTSPRVLDIVCLRMDEQIWGCLNENGTPFQSYRYTAYVDDLTVSAHALEGGEAVLEVPEAIRSRILKIIEENGFIPHSRPDKTKHYSPETGEVPVVTGLVITPQGGITMAPRKVNQLRARLHTMNQLSAWSNEDCNHVSGTLAYVRMIYPEKLPSRLRGIVDVVEQRLAGWRLSHARENAVAVQQSTSPFMLWCDGAVVKNPGRGGIGVSLTENGQEVLAVSRSIGLCTNNEAEYRALIAGLEAAKERGVIELDVCLDSELVVGQLNRETKVNSPALKALYLRVRELSAEMRLNFIHVPREQNERADLLSKQALGLKKRSGKGPRSDKAEDLVFDSI